MTTSEISQRDLRLRSKEIMDSVEHGESFTVTRGGHRIATLAPVRQGRRFVSRTDFFDRSDLVPSIDLDRFRAEQDRAIDQGPHDPYASR